MENLPLSKIKGRYHDLKPKELFFLFYGDLPKPCGPHWLTYGFGIHVLFFFAGFWADRFSSL
jgi:hypothetical protein